MTKKVKFFLLSFIVLIVAAVVTVSFFAYQFLGTGMSKDATEILFDVSPGASMTQIVKDLEDRGFIRNASLFLAYARIKKINTKLKVGEYALNKTMTADQILSALSSGKSVTRNFTIAEGLNVFDVAEIFEQSGIGTKVDFFALIRDKEFAKSLLGEEVETLEGYLFPETYKITKFETMKSIVTQMVKHFLVVWAKYEDLAKQQKWTRNQIITFASIVEKETGAGFERPLVSSVFHNRLAQKIKLQTDPTVLYGIAINKGQMPTNVTKTDLQTPTRYNSYTNYGLPPTPISNPGEDAIKATFLPAQTKYLFFVSKNDGTHVFTENYAAHSAAVKKYQLDAKAREGKSWRDLKAASPNEKARP
ncbi:MAG: endolytic transglycosylase MltG [Pseudobdellovibrio sp.]